MGANFSRKEAKKMLGVIVNTLAVLFGSGVGLLARKGIPQKLADACMLAIGLCTLYIGVSGSLKGENTLVLIVSMVFGTAAGTLLDIDGALARLGKAVERRFRRREQKTNLAEAFVTASLLFCIGAMTFVGCINAGLRNDHELLLTKSLLDCISACMLSVTMGVGVMLSSVFVLVFQGAIVLLAQLLAPVLSDAAIAELTCCGSVMILAIGLNMLGLTKLKVANFLPALVFVPVFTWLLSYLPI